MAAADRMQAVYVTRIGGPDVLEATKVAKPNPRPGEALLRITYAGVIFNDVMMRTDFWRHAGDPERATPFILGAEAVGWVEAIGSDVADLKLGQRVGVAMHDPPRARLGGPDDV